MAGGVRSKEESEPQAIKLVLLGLQLLEGKATVKEMTEWAVHDAFGNDGVIQMDIVDLINCDPSVLMRKMYNRGLITRTQEKRTYVYGFIGELPTIYDHHPDNPHY